MNGILLIDKPSGWTSHDVVAKVRGILREQQKQKPWPTHGDAVQGADEQRTKVYGEYSEGAAQSATQQSAPSSSGADGLAGRQAGAMRRIKVGHTGTLDPFATGLLILVVGNYTKKAAEYSKLDKTYEAEITLGSTSTTGDVEGEITDRLQGAGGRLQKPSKEAIEVVLRQFKGEIEQTPHKFSAIKVDGQRAYALARAGKEVDLEPRKVTVRRLQVADYTYPKLKIVTEVSSGTYIRSLAEDIGKKLGTGAYLSALRRTSVGNFDVKNAKTLEKLSLTGVDTLL